MQQERACASKLDTHVFEHLGKMFGDICASPLSGAGSIVGVCQELLAHKHGDRVEIVLAIGRILAQECEALEQNTSNDRHFCWITRANLREALHMAGRVFAGVAPA